MRLTTRSLRVATAGFLLLGASACASRSSSSSFLPPTRPAQFSLVGVPWGVGADSLTTLIEPRGYNYNRTDEDGDLWYDGMLFQTPTRIYAFMADQRLVKFRVLINTPDEDALTMYQRVRAELVKQFGAPEETVEEYQAPFRKGDGKELQAIQSGKALVRTHWLPGASSRIPFVSVTVTSRLVVVVDYDSAQWEKESIRRRRAASR